MTAPLRISRDLYVWLSSHPDVEKVRIEERGFRAELKGGKALVIEVTVEPRESA